MKRIDLTRYVPAGIALNPEKQLFGAGFACAVIYSFGFLFRYLNARGELFAYEAGQPVLIEGSVMRDFAQLYKGTNLGFAFIALCMVALAVYHYLYHRQGSRSMYLMRRLPNRWELHRRCLSLPLAGICICLVSAAFFLLIYFGVYMLCTPKQCLTPHQWQMIWSVVP